MNIKTLLIFGATLISILLGVSMTLGNQPIMGLVLLAASAGFIYLIYKKKKATPEKEEKLYERLTKAIEGGPVKQKMPGNLILTGTRPAKINSKGEQTVTTKAIQGSNKIGKIVNYRGVEVTIPVYNEEGEETGTKETFLYAFTVVQKTGLLSKDKYIVYAFEEELLRPVRDKEDVVIQAVDIFPFTDKHYITSTSPGRKISVFVTDLGILANSKNILNRLGEITERTLESDLDYQRRMRQGGTMIDLGKQGIKKAKGQYDTLTNKLENQANSGPRVNLPKGKK